MESEPVQRRNPMDEFAFFVVEIRAYAGEYEHRIIPFSHD
jgi:hypothetical protein